MKQIYLFLWAAIGVVLLSTGCSSTSAIPDGEQLYTGMKPTEYVDADKSEHAASVREELDVVLATKPNGSLFGSPTLQSPLKIGLWIWNAFSQGTTSFDKWMVKAFGTQPVLMSYANPDLHTTVGRNLLKKRGYFNGDISYSLVPQKNPKKMKLQYAVKMGQLWTIDTLGYVGFTPGQDSLISAHADEAMTRSGAPFDISTLESERQRITQLFRDNGYFYYEKGMASYLADSVSRPGTVAVNLQLLDSIDGRALRTWTIRNINVNLRRSLFENIDTTSHGRSLRVRYNGTHSPLRRRVLSNQIKLKRGDLYSASLQEETQQRLNATGIFSQTRLSFVPIDSTDQCSQLDVVADCVFDKPYDFFIEAYGKGKTSGKFGPELIMGLTKRNAFRGGELLNFRVNGAFEWTWGRSDNQETSGMSSYEYGGEVSLQLPRLLIPFRGTAKQRHAKARRRIQEAIARGEDPATVRRRRKVYYETPMTTLRASTSVINRKAYFKRHVVSGELTYNWKPTERSEYKFSPLLLTYEYMPSHTERFDQMTEELPYLAMSFSDQFIPKLEFSYTYQSKAGTPNPIKWWTTLSEASNLLSLGYMVAGKKWDEKGKLMFKNPYAQFVKFETNFTKQWSTGEKSTLVAHVGAGGIFSYGNSTYAPYTEQFFVGGANSIRAFNAREIGPGRYRSVSPLFSYVEQTGDLKFVANLEYRPHLVGSLYGAAFLDMGNVWTLKKHDEMEQTTFQIKRIFKDVAFGTGVGLRYDVGFFILRVDWGLGLHLPYDTGKSGFFNIGHFKDAQTLHFAVGLPF